MLSDEQLEGGGGSSLVAGSQAHVSLGGHSIHEILELSEESESISRSITKVLKYKELEQIEVKAF